MLDPLGVRKKFDKFRGCQSSDEEWLAFVRRTEEYINEDPFWVCFCQLPGDQPLQQETAEWNASCIFQPEKFYFLVIATSEYASRVVPTRDAYLHKKGGCTCKRRAIDHPGHDLIMTSTGFDSAHGDRSSMAKPSESMVARPYDVPAIRHMIGFLEDPISECNYAMGSPVPPPFRIWPLVEAIAFLTNDSWFDLSQATDGEERAQIIALTGTMLLTVIDCLISQELFTTKDTPIIRNLSLVLALMLKFGSAVDVDDYCPSNENGWTWVVLCLAEKHQVEIKGFDGLDSIIKTIRDKGTELDAKRDRERGNWWLKEQWGIMRLPTEKEIEAYAANEGEPPCKRGTGRRRKWLLEDDYDPDGRRYWKRWNLEDEYALYLKDSAKRERGKQPKRTTATRVPKCSHRIKPL